jgi:hypothetical protein
LQVSTWIWPFCTVLRVVNLLPHEHETWVATYCGWMSAFMAWVFLSSWSLGRPAAFPGVNQYLADHP